METGNLEFILAWASVLARARPRSGFLSGSRVVPESHDARVGYSGTEQPNR